MRKGPVPVSAFDRVLRKVKVVGECWIFGGHTNASGHGRIRVGSLVDGSRATRPAHVVIYEERSGPVPDGHDLHHLCHTPACVNPEHLQPISHADHPREHRQIICAKCGTNDWYEIPAKKYRRCRECFRRYTKTHCAG